MITSSLIGNLWGPLLSAPPVAPCQGRTFPARASEMAGPGTKTAEILAALAHSPASSFGLAEITGLTNRQIWGLLKGPKDRGLVTYDPDSGIWTLNADYQGSAIERAKALLESQGWKCIPPGH